MAKRKTKAQVERETEDRLAGVERTWKADRASGRPLTLNASQIYAYLAGLLGRPTTEQAIEIVNAVERDPHLYLTTGTNCENFGRIQVIATGFGEDQDDLN